MVSKRKESGIYIFHRKGGGYLYTRLAAFRGLLINLKWQCQSDTRITDVAYRSHIPAVTESDVLHT